MDPRVRAMARAGLLNRIEGGSGGGGAWYPKLSGSQAARVAEEVAGSTTPDIYHVTFSDRVQKIRKDGLSPFGGGSSNWTRGGERYQKLPSVFAFDNAKDALRWAKKMEYEFGVGRGSKTPAISILRIRRAGEWGDDPSADPTLAFYGKSLTTNKRIAPENVVDAVNLSDLPSPAKTGLPFDDWLESFGSKLFTKTK